MAVPILYLHLQYDTDISELKISAHAYINPIAAKDDTYFHYFFGSEECRKTFQVILPLTENKIQQQ